MYGIDETVKFLDLNLSVLQVPQPNYSDSSYWRGGDARGSGIYCT
jgi:hypothetical protein